MGALPSTECITAQHTPRQEGLPRLPVALAGRTQRPVLVCSDDMGSEMAVKFSFRSTEQQSCELVTCLGVSSQCGSCHRVCSLWEGQDLGQGQDMESPCAPAIRRQREPRVQANTVHSRSSHKENTADFSRPRLRY